MRKKLYTRLLLLVLLAGYFQNVRSQEYFSQPSSRQLARIPFKLYSGGVVLLRATLDQLPDTLNFILDTGSGGISLDSTTVESLGIKTEASDRTIRGIAGLKQVRFANNHSLNFTGLRVDSLNFHINDYDILSSVYGEHIDGIIGYSFLSRYIVKLDYDSLIMTVSTRGAIKYPKGGYLIRPNLATIPVTTNRMTESRTITNRFFFDTGAGLCLLFNSDFVEDSTVFSSRKKMYTTQAEGLGGKTYMKLTTTKEFRIGPYKFRKVPTYIFDDEFNVTSYPYLGGLVGNDILRRFNVIFNYERRDIYLMPNKHFREDFDYSYTGLGFYQINGSVVITDIMQGSPAAESGFKEGDVILAINNVVGKGIQTYRNMLQTPGERLKFLIQREGKLYEVYMRVGSILKK
ncbi:aspartyl protease family protein [Flavihumibacter rivuli]|uniref:aspartyl protease family protein n=1 Tax=Flavihumibacter rivuli TaxID=2838156 RepID=UPI001BDDF593|nr:aspartyl protease family protein [Flavihumibacter rivuli]ULQ55576.1 aspartyl protease family protein [Flavihumibacter rivuli]